MNQTRIYENIDCMVGMEKYSDLLKSRNVLAIVDPPYGIGMDKPIIMKEIKNKFGKLRTNANYKKSNWDGATPDETYFDKLFEVSKNQIICGGNYFTKHLPPTNAWIFWDKKLNENNGKTFSDGELLWTSFKFSLTKYTYGWVGFDYINNPQKEIKIHPTHKPTALYKWLLENYAICKECDGIGYVSNASGINTDCDVKICPKCKGIGPLILDTHVGSASSLIACEEFGIDYIGFELDEDYYKESKQRLEKARYERESKVAKECVTEGLTLFDRESI